jgi:hypothetical protein
MLKLKQALWNFLELHSNQPSQKTAQGHSGQRWFSATRLALAANPPKGPSVANNCSRSPPLSGNGQVHHPLPGTGLDRLSSRRGEALLAACYLHLQLKLWINSPRCEKQSCVDWLGRGSHRQHIPETYVMNRISTLDSNAKTEGIYARI